MKSYKLKPLLLALSMILPSIAFAEESYEGKSQAEINKQGQNYAKSLNKGTPTNGSSNGVMGMFEGVENNYKNIAKTMFFRDLYTVLWSMLFIIPGIVKSYEYQMIPYLLADNPQMTKEEAFAESKRMMQGQKWNAFVLDLSFIGWDILSGMTMGILGIFYVQPYKDGTHAALYEALRYRTPYQQIQNPAPYQQNTAMNQQTTEMPNRFENQNIDQPFEDRTDY